MVVKNKNQYAHHTIRSQSLCLDDPCQPNYEKDSKFFNYCITRKYSASPNPSCLGNIFFPRTISYYQDLLWLSVLIMVPKNLIDNMKEGNRKKGKIKNLLRIFEE